MLVRAAVFHGPGQPHELAELEMRPPGPRDVAVRMAAIGVCGSDLHVVKGEWPRPLPMVLGHEGAGVVESVGSDVEGVKPGDRVVLSWAPGCGECVSCKRGRPAACVPLRVAVAAGTMLDGSTGLALRGEPVRRMTSMGCLSDICVMPAASALPLPDSVGLAEAALLGCAALTGVGAALNAAAIEPGGTVLVLGAGAVGLFCVQGARLAGAGVICCVDPLASRRAEALALGATHACPPEDLETLTRELTNDGFDSALDAVGHPATTVTALARVRPLGTACAVGMAAAGERLDLDPSELTVREKRLTGSLYGSDDPALALPRLLAEVAAGRLELASLLGPVYPLERIDEAIADSLAGNPKRVLVAPAGAL